ncbi:hypothetical protein IAT40_003488 [Kwoniella sp. CBS 6097]
MSEAPSFVGSGRSRAITLEEVHGADQNPTSAHTTKTDRLKPDSTAFGSQHSTVGAARSTIESWQNGRSSFADQISKVSEGEKAWKDEGMRGAGNSAANMARSTVANSNITEARDLEGSMGK